MPNPDNEPQLPKNQSPIIDDRTGLVSRDWYRFFLNLLNRTGTGTVTSVDVSGGTTGLTTSGGPVTTSGTITLAGTLDVDNGGTGAITAAGARTNLDVPSTTGSGATGTWNIDILGNSGTVTNGVYTTGSYADPTWITSIAGSKVTGNISGQAGSVANALTSGTGISYSVGTTYDGSVAVTINNSAPDQTVSLTGGTGISTSGTYPSFTITNTLPMTYPGAGIPNSTGTAWGTSYSTTGSGTVVALATSPSFTTPILGTPQSGNFSTGTFTWPTFNQNTTGSAATLTTGRTISITGDLAYTSPSFNGSANVTAAGTLATVNLNVGSFTNASITVNGKGLITAASSGTAPVTSVTGTSPVVSSGGTTPAISLASGYGDTQNPYASKTANFFLAAPNGVAGVPTFRAVVAADIPTLNQNTTGTASNVTGVVAVANGGSGQTTAQTAMNTFAGAITSGQYLRGNGTNVVMSAIQAADVPTLNQNTTGTASNVTGTVAIANGGTGQTTKIAAFDALSPVTTKGDLIVGDGTDNVRLPVGADGLVLQADSTQTTGLKWAAAGSSGATITNDTATSTNVYPTFTAATSGTLSTIYTSNAKLLYKPSTGELTSEHLVAGNGIFVNSLTIDVSYTIAAGTSGMSAGPVTVASGTTVTVASGSRWVVV